MTPTAPDAPASPASDELVATRLSRLFGTRRASLTFVGILFVITAVRAMSDPLAIVLDVEAVWDYRIPLALVTVIVIVGCAAQSASILLSVSRPGLAAVLAASIYVGLILWVEVPQWLSGMPYVVAVAMFFVAAQRTVRVALAWLAAVTIITAAGVTAWTLSVGAPLGIVTGFLAASLVAFVAPVAGATAFGTWWGIRSRRIAEAQATAEAAAREHDERVERAREHERARIAQELHDVAGQHLAGLLSLADAAIDIETRDPERALSLLDDMRAEGRFASASLYAALRDLRAPDAAAGETTPHLASLAELVSYWNARGMTVTIDTRGDLAELPAVVSTTVYRGIQEALTNAAKHAPGAAVTVEVAFDGTWVRASVENAAPRHTRAASDAPGLGWGLESLAQRTDILGGTFGATATAEGGWRVTLTVPVTDVAASPALV